MVDEWKNHQVTKALFNKLEQSKEDAKVAWECERFVGFDNNDSARKNATALGGIRVVNEILGIKAEDL
jgi:hypothetical protein